EPTITVGESVLKGNSPFPATVRREEIHLFTPCKTAFLSHKHNNDLDDEQTLIQEQITEKMSRLCWTTLRPRPLFKCLWTHTHTSTSSSQMPANNVFLVFLK